eukprot:gene4585-5724_t
MNNRIGYFLLVLSIVTVTLVEASIPVQTLNSIKDITFTLSHNNNNDQIDSNRNTRCTVQFKPRLIPHSTNSISSIDSVSYTKVFTTNCHSSLSNQNERIKYQQQSEFFKTTVTSSRDNSLPTFSTLPRNILNDSSLTYEYLKLNLDSNTLQLISSNFKLTGDIPIIHNVDSASTPQTTTSTTATTKKIESSTTTNTQQPKQQLYVQIEFTSDSRPPVIEPPKPEKEKEKENQSFFAKYWYYLLPLGLLAVVNILSGFVEEAPAQGGAAQGGARRR